MNWINPENGSLDLIRNIRALFLVIKTSISPIPHRFSAVTAPFTESTRFPDTAVPLKQPLIFCIPREKAFRES
jgi:hypothetical protein